MPRTINHEELSTRVIERMTLAVAEQCLQERGALYRQLARAGAEVPEFRKELRAEAARRLESMKKEGVRASTREGAERLLREPQRPLPVLKRRQVPVPALPQHQVADPWKYVQLRIDWTKCVRETKLEPGADEMYLVGVLIDLGAPETDRRKINFHLGDFRTGEREEYAGTRVVSYADISNAGAFPTRVKCLLSVMEKDADGIFADLIDELLDVAKSVIYQELEAEDDEIMDGGEIDWEKLIKMMLEVLFGWLKKIPAPEVLKYHTRPVFEFVSPQVKSLADRWSPDRKSDDKTFVVKGHGGTYKVNLFFQRSKSAHGT